MFPKSVHDTMRITFTILGIVVGGWLLFLLRDIILSLFIAFIISSALLPLVSALGRLGAPRWLTVLWVYVLFLAIIGVVLWGFIPIVAEQVRTFFATLPAIFVQVVDILQINDLIQSVDLHVLLPEIFQSFSNEILATPTNLIGVIVGLFSRFANVFILFVFSYYMLLEHDRIKRHVLLLFDKKDRSVVADILERVEHKLGAWLRGQVTVMIITGILTFAGYYVLGVKFATSLAVLAALFEIVPIFGPIVAVIPAVLVALTQSVWHAIGVVVIFTIIQQVGGVTIVPKVMNKAIGIDPLVIILAIMVGGRLAGAAGILIAIPTAAIISIFWGEFLERRS